MLRHYDESGVLHPERVDDVTGFRWYSMAQLGRLHRVVALRDLGFTLDQMQVVLDDDPPLDQLRGMLRLRRAQLEHGLAEDEARLRRVDAHLRALERSNTMPTHNIVVKTTDVLRVAETSATAPGFGSENLGPIFERLVPIVLARIHESDARPHIMVAWYEEPDDDGSVILHAGFDIEDQPVVSDDQVRVVELPIVEVASVIHRGTMDNIEAAYETLVRWVEDSGYQLTGRSRELYHQHDHTNPTQNVTELQLPITT